MLHTAGEAGDGYEIKSNNSKENSTDTSARVQHWEDVLSLINLRLAAISYSRSPRRDQISGLECYRPEVARKRPSWWHTSHDRHGAHSTWSRGGFVPRDMIAGIA